MRHPLLLFIVLLTLLAAASGFAMNKKVRIELLKAHNEARSDVSPAASNMPFMVWNTTLENLAQQWAERCTFEYGQSDEDMQGKLGQNLYPDDWSAREDIDGESVIAWEREKANYTYDTLDCAAGEICEHYTQVVWAKSTQVGCGVHYCREMENANYYYLIVCNYFTQGNEKNEAPYEMGPACSACPEDYTGGCQKNLCIYNTGVRPCVRPYTLLLTAALGALLYSNL